MKTIFIIVCMLFTINVFSQSVGIGSTSFTPISLLEIKSNTIAGDVAGNGLTISNSALETDMKNELWFKSGTKYTGAIKTIGHSTTTARLGLFTGSSITLTNLSERFSIYNDGKIMLGRDLSATPEDPNTFVDIVNHDGNAKQSILTLRKDNYTTNNEVGLRLINSTSAASIAGVELTSKLINSADGRSDFIIYAHNGTTLGEKIRLVGNTGNLGIGNSSPTSMLSVGSSSEFQVNSTGDIVKINNVTTNFPGTQGSANTFLKNNGSGVLSWSQPYGDNIQYAEGTTDISTSSAVMTDMTNMSITFTPVHNYIYLTFTASGSVDVTLSTWSYIMFNILKDGTALSSGGVVTLSSFTDISKTGTITSIGAWNCSTTRRIAVTSGTPTTIKIQWMTNGISFGTVYNNVATSNSYSHRAMMITD